MFVTNETPHMGRVTDIQKLTFNILPKLVRHDKMEDRDFLVVPMVMLTEGVHNGSKGPVYYPPEELSKTPEAWNHKPVVVYHPSLNGVGVSACDPAIITNRKVGVIMNTKFAGGRLTSEAWIEKSRADVVDERIMKAITDNEMMELSTGVFIDCDATPGEWKGETYVGVARNYRPDHLALLPDQIGACSLKDGAGFLRNAANEPNEQIPLALIPVLKKLLDNFVGNKQDNSNPNTMNKKQIIDALLLIANSGWKEEDRPKLEAFSVEQLTVIQNAAQPKKEDKKETPAPVVPAVNTTPKVETPAPVIPPVPAPVTMESYIASAPKEFRDVIVNGIDLLNREKVSLIETITGNKNNVFTKEDLNHRPIGELRALARLAGVSVVPDPQASYYGGMAPVPAQNREVEEVMTMPVMDYTAKK